ncbi:hypothetical protein ACI78P_01425 [Leuconostoc mesenteroides]
MAAIHANENVVPDILAAGKMLTGGNLPLAITMVSEAIYQVFLMITMK